MLIGTAMLNAMWASKRKDTFDLLLPFVRYSIGKTTKQGEVVNAQAVSNLLEIEFGFEAISGSVLGAMFNRLVSASTLNRKHGKYHLVCSLDQDVCQFETQRTVFREHRDAVGEKLSCFLNDRLSGQTYDIASATTALLGFFRANGICVAKNAEALELLRRRDGKESYYIAQFILHERQNESAVFDYILDMVKGFFVSAAISFQPSNSEMANSKFKSTRCYLDTSILLSALGLHSAEEKNSACQLLQMLEKQNAEVACFEHTVDEIRDVIDAYRRSLYHSHRSPSRVGRTLEGWDEEGISPAGIDSYLLVLEAKIKKLGVTIVEKPSVLAYRDYCVSLEELEEAITSNINYINKAAVRNDVDSIASVVMFRKGFLSPTIEKCKHLFVTSNRTLVWASNQYFRNTVQGNTPPSITDMDLSAILWLKSSSVNKDFPEVKLIENAVLALNPSQEMMEAFFASIEKVRSEGGVSEEEAVLLRSGLYPRRELMELAKGDLSNIDDTLVCEMRDKLKEKYVDEQNAITRAIQRQLSEELEANQARLSVALSVIKETGEKKAKAARIVCNVVVVVLLLAALAVCIYMAYLGFTETSTFFAGSATMLLLDLLGVYDIFRGRRQWIAKQVNRIVNYFADRAKDAKREEYRQLFGNSVDG